MMWRITATTCGVWRAMTAPASWSGCAPTPRCCSSGSPSSAWSAFRDKFESPNSYYHLCSDGQSSPGTAPTPHAPRCAPAPASPSGSSCSTCWTCTAGGDGHPLGDGQPAVQPLSAQIQLHR
ncbi:hypothetical protein INR49_020640 [Caranx melampygus]|nr:hypothetical protein INR49_020640 [Caranx melampygus]